MFLQESWAGALIGKLTEKGLPRSFSSICGFEWIWPGCYTRLSAFACAGPGFSKGECSSSDLCCKDGCTTPYSHTRTGRPWCRTNSGGLFFKSLRHVKKLSSPLCAQQNIPSPTPISHLLLPLSPAERGGSGEDRREGEGCLQSLSCLPSASLCTSRLG